MDSFMNTLSNTMAILRWNDILDIGILTLVIFWIVSQVKDTSAGQVLKAIIIIIFVTQLATWAELYATTYIFDAILQIGAIALVVVFQPELRRILIRLGSSNATELFKKDRENGKNAFESYIAIILKTVYDLSATKTGALIVFERNTSLGEIAATGTAVDAEISGELIKNIFFVNTPLHDGAMIIRNFRIHAAGCTLPLTKNEALSKDMGTRHKAGTGLSEQSDAVVVIVSEETGAVSCAVGGMLKRHLAKETLEKLLIHELAPAKEARKLIGLRAGKEGRK